VTDVVVVIEEETVTPRVSDQAEEVARAAAALSLRGAELATVRRLPTLRPVARDVAALAALSVTLITAFVFANWAAASALSAVLTDWQAALVLTAAWAAIGIVVAAVLLRGGPLARNWRRVAAPTSDENLREREEAVAEAEQRLRDSIDRLGDAIAQAAEQRIAAAVLPLAGGMVEVGEDMVDATDEIIEKADEITDVIEERLPGGVVVNRAFDFVLMPGRFGVRVVRSVLSVERPPE